MGVVRQPRPAAAIGSAVRKNWLARVETNTVRRGLRGVAGRWFRARPIIPDPAFQDADEPYPGHWRTFPSPWPPTPTEQVRVAFEELPPVWRSVLLRHGASDPASALPAAGDGPTDPGLTEAQERDILTRARAALRDAVERRARASDPPASR
jgi:hypothetical protein